jgi:hypothetical protein
VLSDASDHSAAVDAWMQRAATDTRPEQLIQSFEQGFAVLWKRAHLTLGDVTLMAIVDRVLCNAAEEYRFLSSLKIEASGLQCEQLRASAGNAPQDRLAEGLRFVLVEFLTVLGTLTAEILTPALHAALSDVALEASGASQPKSEGEPANQARRHGKKAKR